MTRWDVSYHPDVNSFLRTAWPIGCYYCAQICPVMLWILDTATILTDEDQWFLNDGSVGAELWIHACTRSSAPSPLGSSEVFGKGLAQLFLLLLVRTLMRTLSRRISPQLWWCNNTWPAGALGFHPSDQNQHLRVASRADPVTFRACTGSSRGSVTSWLIILWVELFYLRIKCGHCTICLQLSDVVSPSMCCNPIQPRVAALHSGTSSY